MTESLNFSITDNAIAHIGTVLSQEKQGSVFRVAVKGGGCSGFSYDFKIDNHINGDDIIYPCGDYQLVVDNISIAFLKGAVLDYVTQMIGSQFDIKNPNAKSSCGCGVSFSV